MEAVHHEEVQSAGALEKFPDVVGCFVFLAEDHALDDSRGCGGVIDVEPQFFLHPLAGRD